MCNSCWTKAQRKKHCPMPSCTSTKGRGKGSRLRHMPAKWADLNRETKELVARDLRKSNIAQQLQTNSITFSVDFSQSRIGLKKCVFNKRTIKVCVSCF